MVFLDKLKITAPFAYMWLLKKAIGDAKTILDLGCEHGKLMELLSDGEDWQVTGVDIYKKNTAQAAKRKKFIKVISGDIVNVSRRLIKEKKKYDVVFCSQVIEHIDRKRGEELFKLVDKLAKKRIIFGTPRGFMEQPEVFLGDNPHMGHKSGWEEEDFRKRGYKVYGIGISPIWAEQGFARNTNKVMFIILTLLGYVFSPVVYYLPRLGAGILCIKEIDK